MGTKVSNFKMDASCIKVPSTFPIFSRLPKVLCEESCASKHQIIITCMPVCKLIMIFPQPCISTVGTNSHHSQAENNMWKINTVINPKQGCVHVDVLSDYWRLLQQQKIYFMWTSFSCHSKPIYLWTMHKKSYFEENLNSFVYTINSTRSAGFKITFHVT